MGYWQPNARLKKLGFSSVACGADGPQAWAIAHEWSRKAREERKIYDPRTPKCWDMDRDGYVYFLVAGKTVKIGFSKQPGGRALELRTGISKRIDRIIVVRGTRRDEKFLHRKFVDYRLEGEWFRLSADIISLVTKAAKTGTLFDKKSEFFQTDAGAVALN